MATERTLRENATAMERWKRRAAFFLPVLSLFVVLAVFWWLKLVGVTLAGEAFCGMAEHTHGVDCVLVTEACTEDHEHSDSCLAVYDCGRAEHVHVASCYSDLSADLETSSDWEATLSGIPAGLTGGLRVAEVAKSQIGYLESTLNFTVDSDLSRHGYTRYGQWYGNPYGDWSTMFTSFCLRYGGRDSVPISGGAETLRLQWIEADLFQSPSSYTPLPGDVVFLDKNGNGTADSTALLLSRAEGILTVVEGDLENAVAQTEYAETDGSVLGYGLSFAEGSAVVTGNENSIGQTLPDGGTVLATATPFDPDLFTEANRFVIYAWEKDGYYALDGEGVCVPVTVDDQGRVAGGAEDLNTLYWTLSVAEDGSYLGVNRATGRTVSLTLSEDGTLSLVTEEAPAVRMLSARALAAPSASGYALAVAASYTVWFDGTNGGLMTLGGSLNQSSTVTGGDTLKLPAQWQAPVKYNYALRGWYDVKNSKFYAPGAEITVNEDLVFYADWISDSYDYGKLNAETVNTVSTKDFIKTQVFDYNALFNILSSKPSVTVSSSSHSESWSSVALNGAVPYANGTSIDFMFIDYDGSGDVSYVSGRNSRNSSAGVYSGLYTDALGEVLFGTDNGFDPVTGTGIPGKTVLGEGDYLFRVMDDPTDPHYGYYYYDSARNAASYNQSEGRFYVYDYLERTRDSSGVSGEGRYSDFMPFNSPYRVPDGKTVPTYTYEGDYGEFDGTTHYQYDAKYNTNNNNVNYVSANYAFGMSMELDFYLPFAPGTKDENGDYKNLDLYENEMCFEFSGDDDLWVLVDGKVVLDVGGIHGIKSGSVNFSSGEVIVDGTSKGTLSGITAGHHEMSIYYLERGSSQSNCAIYFNLSPRFWLDLRKEDVLTRELLNGAEFSVYTDENCTRPALLWASEEAYQNKEPSTNICTVADGVARIWGFSPGQTYYIKETKAPDLEEYSVAHGLITLTLDKRGGASFHVQVVGDPGDGEDAKPSKGFTAYGYQIEDSTHHAYLVITNGSDWIRETTSVSAFKKWNDSADHSNDTVTAYLTMVDEQGQVQRIREVTLSAENGWLYTWDNLPKHWPDGVTEIVYGVEEAFIPGYTASYETVDRIENSTESWEDVTSFTDGKVYLLKTSSGCLSSVSATGSTLEWVTEEEAKSSPLALWTAKEDDSGMILTNGEGQILTFRYGNNSSSRYYSVTTTAYSSSSTYYQTIYTARSSSSSSTLRLYAVRSNRNYYMGSINSSGRPAASTSTSSALSFTLMEKTSTTEYVEVEGLAYQITNTPLTEATSVKVNKVWDAGVSDPSIYESARITVRLFADGVDTGRTLTLTLQNGWSDTFLGLPYVNKEGNVIVYTVTEVPLSDQWKPEYGETVYHAGSPGTYEITVTNLYRSGFGYELPATNGKGQTPYLLAGAGIIFTSLVLGWVLHRKKHTTN
ncbi:MAG: Cna B-type domain-containing protein [Clostridia bacterium]|nr:Cna B-type domain-containing protein [Clostridia bacterium]